MIKKIGKCPKCGSNKWRTGWENIIYAKCDRCGHIWQYIFIENESDTTTNK